MGNVDLNVEGEWGRVCRSLQETGQAFVHQLHKQDGQSRFGVSTRAQVLDDVWMLQSAQKLNFLLKALHDAVGRWVPGLEEDGVEYLGRADKLVTLDPVHSSIGAYPQRVLLGLDKLNVAEAETALDT